MNVFLSYAVGPWDGAIAARLRAVAAAYDISILLPDRTQVMQNGLSEETNTQIRQSDAVIALATKTAPPQLVRLVNAELHAVAGARKPTIVLIEEGLSLQAAPGTHVVYFNRLQPTHHEASLLNALEQIRQQKQKQNDLTALGWIAGIAIGMIALSELFGDKK